MYVRSAPSWSACGSFIFNGLKKRKPEAYRIGSIMADPVVILIHGATLNWASWNPLRRHLDPRLRVVAVDLPGHGARSNERYTLEGAVRVVAEAAKEVAPAKVVLMGDSLGGYTSMAAASSIPRDQLAGLVIGGCTANFVGAPLRALRLRWFIFGSIAIPIFGEQRLVRRSIPKVMRKMGHTEADTQALLDAHVRMSAFGEAVAALANLDFLPKVAAIDAPILFFNGTKDKYPMQGEAKFLAAAKKGEAQHFDCEHGVTLLKSREIAEAANRFIERILPAAK
jgi:pimeloyl-ACP methyl ester carboxylesterase